MINGNYVVVTEPVKDIEEIITHIMQLKKAGYKYGIIRVMRPNSTKILKPRHVLIREVVEGDPGAIIKMGVMK